MSRMKRVEKQDLRNTLNKVQKARSQPVKPNTASQPKKDLRNTLITRKATTGSGILQNIERKIKNKQKQIRITIDNKPNSTMTMLLEKSGLYADKPANPVFTINNDDAMEISVPSSPITMKNKTKINPNRITVELSNIHPNTSKQDLQAVLKEFGGIERIVIKVTDDKFNGTVLVTYKHKHSGYALIEKFHNKQVDGRVLRVIHIPEESFVGSSSLYSDAPLNKPRLTLSDLANL
ncbi:hypothetical protein HDV01_003179 [Terramyces sp. JEL0728]|nr:hypothetical protein HDV01_003179 [Terramyces sp. JEL0728]